MDNPQDPAAPSAPSAGSPPPNAPPELVSAVTERLVAAGLLKTTGSVLTPEILQALQILVQQAGISVDLGNPNELLEFMNVVAASGSGAGGAAPGGAATGGAGPGGLGPSGVESIPADPGSPTGAAAPGPKYVRNLPGTGNTGW